MAEITDAELSEYLNPTGEPPVLNCSTCGSGKHTGLNGCPTPQQGKPPINVTEAGAG